MQYATSGTTTRAAIILAIACAILMALTAVGLAWSYTVEPAPIAYGQGQVTPFAAK